jgi:tetratricopeptide (TPR) repeat protein
MRTWGHRILTFFRGTTGAPPPSPISPSPEIRQQAAVDGRNNLIIQIQGDGNSLVPHFPHLTLTRYLTRRQHIASESDLLTPYSMAIPMVGREAQMMELRHWMTDGKPISIRVLTGRAGTGKTRLALELCDEAVGKQWDAGFVTDRELERFMAQQNLATWGWQRPTLMVIDYAASRVQQLHDWFVELADNGGDSARPLRILLLERHADPSGGWWQEAFGRGGSDAQAVHHLLSPADRPVVLPGLAAPEERRALLTAILERTGSKERPPSPGADTHFDWQLAELSWGGEPLFLLMAGLTAARLGFGHVLALSRTDLAYAIAERELARIETIAQERGINEQFLSHMAAYVTLCQGLGRIAIEEAIEEEKDALKRHAAGDPPDIADALHTALPGDNGAIHPIQPDVIGEAVLLRVLRPHSQERQDAIVLRAFRRARTHVAATVIRTAQDYSLEGAPEPLAWLDCLAQEGAVNLFVLLEVANQLPLHTLVLRERAAEIYATIVEQARHLVTALDDTEVTYSLLAMSLNNLANRLSDLGHREEALTAAQEAVQLRRQLAAARPDAFLPDLAMSLNNLANRLSDLGHREEALTAAQEAVQLRRQLAVARPDAFLPDLAMSLNNLANRLSDLGRREEALTAAQEAVTVLSPFFLALPSAFAQWMITIVQNYVRFAEQLKRAPDVALLVPVIEKLNALQSQPPGGDP